jgi:hypothetical protein
MKTVCFSKILISSSEFMQHQNSDEQHHHSHCCQNHISHFFLILLSYYLVDVDTAPGLHFHLHIQPELSVFNMFTDALWTCELLTLDGHVIHMASAKGTLTVVHCGSIQWLCLPELVGTSVLFLFMVIAQSEVHLICA